MNEEDRRKQDYLDFKKQFDQDFLLIHRGRMKRLDFFLVVVALNVLARFLGKLEIREDSYLSFFISFVFLYLGVNFILKRIRDIGISPWFATIPIAGSLAAGAFSGFYEGEGFQVHDNTVGTIIIVAVILFVPLYFIPSQKRDNKYGKYYPCSYIGGYKKPKPQKKERVN